MGQDFGSLGGDGSSYFDGWNANTPKLSLPEWRRKIVSVAQDVYNVTKIEIEMIWVVQNVSPTDPRRGIELFRTYGLRERNIKPYYFGGNPLLISRFLSDMYLRGSLWNLEEARALAVYLLWEAKERDPTVGKQSDIVLFRTDGSVRLLGQDEVSYWEEHFKILKREMAILPILSCATGTTQQIYKLQDRLERLALSVKALSKEQEKMRLGKRRPGRIDDVLVPQIRRLTKRQMNREIRRLNPEK